jgi:hypothetical protein
MGHSYRSRKEGFTLRHLASRGKEETGTRPLSLSQIFSKKDGGLDPILMV